MKIKKMNFLQLNESWFNVQPNLLLRAMYAPRSCRKQNFAISICPHKIAKPKMIDGLKHDNVTFMNHFMILVNIY